MEIRPHRSGAVAVFHRDVSLRRIETVFEARPHYLGQTKALGMLVFRCALNEMQNMSVLERDHVPMRGEVDEIRQQAEAHQTLVCPEHVEIVGEIVGGEFPSAIDIPNLWNADELDLAGAVRK